MKMAPPSDLPSLNATDSKISFDIPRLRAEKSHRPLIVAEITQSERHMVLFCRTHHIDIQCYDSLEKPTLDHHDKLHDGARDWRVRSKVPE